MRDSERVITFRLVKERDTSNGITVLITTLSSYMKTNRSDTSINNTTTPFYIANRGEKGVKNLKSWVFFHKLR